LKKEKSCSGDPDYKESRLPIFIVRIRRRTATPAILVLDMKTDRNASHLHRNQETLERTPVIPFVRAALYYHDYYQVKLQV
jgi:hypothetical protein